MTKRLQPHTATVQLDPDFRTLPSKILQLSLIPSLAKTGIKLNLQSLGGESLLVLAGGEGPKGKAARGYGVSRSSTLLS